MAPVACIRCKSKHARPVGNNCTRTPVVTRGRAKLSATALPPVIEQGVATSATPGTNRLPPNSRASLPVGGHMTLESPTDATQAENLPGVSTDINILTSAVLALQKQVHFFTGMV